MAFFGVPLDLEATEAPEVLTALLAFLEDAAVEASNGGLFRTDGAPFVYAALRAVCDSGSAVAVSALLAAPGCDAHAAAQCVVEWATLLPEPLLTSGLTAAFQGSSGVAGCEEAFKKLPVGHRVAADALLHALWLVAAMEGGVEAGAACVCERGGGGVEPSSYCRP